MGKVYEESILQLQALLTGETNTIANLANASALLYQTIEHINWVGFYVYDKNNNELVLGPFQGKVACMHIAMGKGVCGTSALNRETIRVDDVHQFPGHIACDCASNSEIVIPIIIDDQMYGVLDIDSPLYNRFDKIDQNYLEQFVNVLKQHIY